MSKLLPILEHFKNIVLQEQYAHVNQAVKLIRNIIEKPENRTSTYVSFNGGKDATIVLFLTVAAYSQLKIPLSEIKVLYFQQPNSFEEVDQFRKEMKQMIDFVEIKAGRNLPQSLTDLKKHYPIQYIIMGSRKTDPYCCQLITLTPSDVQKGYPQFMRVNPILYWSYKSVWSFILNFQIPYCILYEKGYTYLGNKTNTTRNEQLSLGNGKYQPAWVAEQENQCKSRTKK